MTDAQAKEWLDYATKVARSKGITNPSDIEDAAMAGMTAVIEAATVKTDKPFLTGACENGVFRWLREKDHLTRGQVYLEDVRGDAQVSAEVSYEYTTGGTDRHTGKAVHAEQDFTGLFVEEFIDTLDDRERLVLRLRMDDCTMDEIAKAINQSRQTVDSVLKKIGQKYLEWA